MRPRRSTWVASMTSSPAPEFDSMPRWVMCQSLPAPSSALYWHIGDTTTRFGRVRSASLIGENKALGSDAHICLRKRSGFEEGARSKRWGERPGHSGSWPGPRCCRGTFGLWITLPSLPNLVRPSRCRYPVRTGPRRRVIVRQQILAGERHPGDRGPLVAHPQHFAHFVEKFGFGEVVPPAPAVA